MNLPAIRVNELAKTMLQRCEQPDCHLIHHFGSGFYVREARFPKDSMILGARHKVPCINIFLKGKMQLSINGAEPRTIEAPQTFPSRADFKIAHVIEDTIWQNVWACERNDIEELEERLLEFPSSYFEHFHNQARVQSNFHDSDRKDYAKFLLEEGLTDEQVLRISHDKRDQAHLPDGSYKFGVRESPIHGKGIFTTAPIEKDEVIGPASIRGCRTVLGRTMNHSVHPNCHGEVVGGSIMLIADKYLKTGVEITNNYRAARQTVKKLGI